MMKSLHHILVARLNAHRFWLTLTQSPADTGWFNTLWLMCVFLLSVCVCVCKCKACFLTQVVGADQWRRAIHSPLKSVSGTSVTLIQIHLRCRTHQDLGRWEENIHHFIFRTLKSVFFFNTLLNYIFFSCCRKEKKKALDLCAKTLHSRHIKSSGDNHVGLREDQREHGEHSSRAESLRGKEWGGYQCLSQSAQQHPHPRQDPRVLPAPSALQEKPSAGNWDSRASPAQPEPGSR